MILAHDQWQNGNVQKMCEIGTYPQYRGKVEGLLRKRIGNLAPVFNDDGTFGSNVLVDEAYVQKKMKAYDALWEKIGGGKVDYVAKKEAQVQRLKKNYDGILLEQEEELTHLKKIFPKRKSSPKRK